MVKVLHPFFDILICFTKIADVLIEFWVLVIVLIWSGTKVRTSFRVTRV